MRGLRLTTLPDGRTAVIIRTSDRLNFKQCRRKWGWSSHLKRNLGPNYLASPLWFGSAIHYALEDFHGYNHFGHPREAFIAYCIATARQHLRELPMDAQELLELGKSMMEYYADKWLVYKAHDKTYWEEDPDTGEMIPQVEVNFEIPIPIDISPIVQAHCERQGIDVILYRGTLDRVCIDDYGQLWIDEYKTAKVAEHLHYQTDPQISTYVWAASQVYSKPVAGVIYHQFVKRAPEHPRALTSGKISTASNLTTSWIMYREGLQRIYGSVEQAPEENRKYLTMLAGSESRERGDRYIQREEVHRNVITGQSEAAKIIMELEDILNPELPLYSNPTRDCPRRCSFLSACVSMDDGSDWEYELASEFSERDQDVDRMWRNRLPDPGKLKELRQGDLMPDLTAIQDISIEAANTQKMAKLQNDDGTFNFNW